MKTRRHNTRSSSTSTNGKEKALDQPLPFDLVIEILARLPAKSLARSRCLSKLYASTLCTPNFTDSFLISSRPKLLFTVLKDGKSFFFSSLQPQNRSPVTADLHMSFSISCLHEFSRPVHGLVCGLNKKTLKGQKVTEPLICNPSTGQFFNLPIVKTTNRKVTSFLGYDPIEKQFKVLFMTESYATKPFPSNEYQVLTLGTEKKPSWRMIKCDIPPELLGNAVYRYRRSVYDEICINGVLYYLAFTYTKSLDIVCFDVRSEKFSFIKRAHEDINYYFGVKIEPALVNYKGKLAKLQANFDFSRKKTFIHLWVLEDAERQEWSIHIYVLPPPLENIVANTKLRFVGMSTGTGEIVLSPINISDSFYLLYYNPKTSNITKVRVQGMEAFQSKRACTFFDHVEDVKLIKKVL